MGSVEEPLDVMGELKRAGAVLLDQHFVYKSGKHGPGYINMDPIYTESRLMASIADELLLAFAGTHFDTVAAPAVGGVSLVTCVGLVAVNRYSHPVRIVWADKDGDEFEFSRAGFKEHLYGKQVLVVEDLLTTGGSVLRVCDTVQAEGGQIVGVSAICNRGGVTAEQLAVPQLKTLAEVNFTAVDAEHCPQCAKEVPIVENIGHGANYRSEHPEYAGGYTKLKL